MGELVDQTNGRLNEAFLHALRTGDATLPDNLLFLRDYGEGDRNGGGALKRPNRCTLFSDFSPYSMTFLLESRVNGEWKRSLFGGLIFHGAHDRGGDGGPPTFSVSLTPASGWRIHT